MDCGGYNAILVPPQTARLRWDAVVSVSTGRRSSSRIAAIGYFIIHSTFPAITSRLCDVLPRTAGSLTAAGV